MNILTFPKFSAIPNLIHGFSNREFGSMRPTDPNYVQSFQNFLSALKIPSTQIVRMHQVHSNTIRWVTKNDVHTIVDQTDGLITKDNNVFLTVIVGDCAPILFFDQKKEYSGVAHAGWRGVYSNIAGHLIQQLLSQGSKVEDILVGIGPCIGSCCYKVSAQRIAQFREKYKTGNFVKPDNYLDLPALIKQQVTEVGVPEKNIVDAQICTVDNNDQFYSYRKEGETFGEFMGIIGKV